MAKAKKTPPTPDAAPKKAAAKAKAAGRAGRRWSTRPWPPGPRPSSSSPAWPRPMATPAAGKESASFKQMKQSLANPAASGLDSVLDKTARPGSRKAERPVHRPRAGGGGGGRNQTFGADVNRTGVPRRTSGG